MRPRRPELIMHLERAVAPGSSSLTVWSVVGPASASAVMSSSLQRRRQTSRPSEPMSAASSRSRCPKKPSVIEPFRQAHVVAALALRAQPAGDERTNDEPRLRSSPTFADPEPISWNPAGVRVPGLKRQDDLGLLALVWLLHTQWSGTARRRVSSAHHHVELAPRPGAVSISSSFSASRKACSLAAFDRKPREDLRLSCRGASEERTADPAR